MITEPGTAHNAALRRRAIVCHLAVGILCAIAFWQMVRLCAWRYYHFRAGTFDLGINQQEVWLIGQGLRPFATTRGLHFLGDHFTPILYLLGPFQRLFTDPVYIIVVQSLDLTLGCIPLYRMALRRTENPGLSLLLAGCYMAHPSLWGIALFDFHPLSLAVLPLLIAFDALDAGRPVPFLIGCALALPCEERVAASVFLLGVLAWLWRRWRLGWLVSLVSLAWLFAALKLMGYFSGSHASSYWSLYGTLFRAMHHGPMATLVAAFGLLTSILCQRYALLLLAPFAFISLAGGEVTLVALPVLLANLLSDRLFSHITGFQYDTVPFACTAAAAAVGLGRLVQLSPSARLGTARQQTNRRGHLMLAVILVLSGGLSFYRYRPVAIGMWCSYYMPAGLQRERNAVLRLIPPTASVSAQTELATHLAQRRLIYMFPNPITSLCYGGSPQALEQEDGRDFNLPNTAGMHHRLAQATVQFIVITQPDRVFFPFGLAHAADYRRLALDTLTSPAYGIRAARGDIILLERSAPFLAGLRQFGIPHPRRLTDAALRDAILDRWTHIKRAWAAPRGSGAG